MTGIVHAKSAAALLAHVPALIGLAPRDSLVVVGFHDRRTGGGFRYPLPKPGDRAERDALLAAAVGTACRIPSLEAVVLVLYTPRRFAGRAMPDLDTARAAAAAFERAGFQVLDVYVVAADGWGALDEPAPPPGGHPLAELDAVPLDVPAPPDFGSLPARDRAAAARIAGRLRAVERDPAALADSDPIRLLEALLRSGDPRSDPDAAAAVIALVAIPELRDAALLQCGFGTAAAEDCLDQSERIRREAARRGLAVHEYTGEIAVDDPTSRLLLGRTSAVPETERLLRAHRVIGMLVADAPRRYRPALLTVLGWLSWALGMGSAAGRHFARARAIRPGYGLADLLDAWIAHGALPDWVFPSGAPRVDVDDR